ncbi:MAG: thioredoxin family protein [Desulfomonilaceae bacterium]|nr:thioredoxin family protein [Desulfomonilaceae bacterium]
MSLRTRYILITAVLVGIFAGLTYVIFIMDRSASLSEETHIDLEELLSKKKPVLLEFGKGWCSPCKYMKPILEKTSRAFEGKAVVATVDMDVNMHLVRQFSIRVMPTQIFLWPNGTEFFRNEGVLELEQIVLIFGKMGLTP